MEATIARVPEGEERVRATAEQIVKSLGASEKVTRDMLRILSNFDNRLSDMSSTMMGPAKMEQNLEPAEQTISKWEARQSPAFDSGRGDAEEYMNAVDYLQNLMENLPDPNSEKMIRAQHLMQVATSRLEKEFHRILLLHNEPLDPEWIPGRASFRSEECSCSCSCSDDEGAVPAEAVSDLRGIARRMVRAGHGRECVRVLGTVRRSVVDENLYRLGIDGLLGPGALQRLDWETMEGKIKNWTRAARVAVRVVFAGEKRLCEEIFDGFGPIAESCFTEIAQGPATHLFDFAEAVATGKRSPEKLFRVLDLYEAMADLVPDVGVVLSSARARAEGILVRLGDAARGMLSEFGNAIQREASKVPIPGGAIHPLARYVMNYICFLCDYKGTLGSLLVDYPVDAPKALLGDFDRADDESRDPAARSLALHLGWIIVVLQCRLDGKAKLYKDLALSHLFLMNNLHYIVQKVKGSELKDLLGDDWLRRHSGKVRQYATNYERAAWIRVLSCLRDEGVHVSRSVSGGGVSKQALKERFKSFNVAIEEVHRIQAGWVVSDVQLREELQISVAEKLVPAYRFFLGRFGSHLEGDRHSEMYIKYTAEDLENSLLDLFQGTPLPACMRRSR